MGVRAVELLLDGKSNLMVGIRNNKIETTELDKAIKGTHHIDKELIRVSDIMGV
jgi:6-phosphofructokinase 1